MRKPLILTTVILAAVMCFAGCKPLSSINEFTPSPISTATSIAAPSTTTPVETPAVTPTIAPAVTPVFTPTIAPAVMPTVTPLPSDTEETALVDGTVHYTGTVTGYFVEIQTGDYIHVCIWTEDGEALWFWVSAHCDTDFEKLKPGQKLEVTWENCDVYIDEAGEVINMDMITEAEVLD